MLIGIDGNEANLPIRVGVGQYAFNILWNLYKLRGEDEYIVYLKSEPLADMPKAQKGWSYRVFGPKKLWTKIALPFHLYLQKEKLDLFYSPSHYSPQFSPFPTVPTIHDLGYLKFQEQFTKKDLYQLINWTKRSIDRAKGIVAVSGFTKQTIVDTYGIDPQKIYLAYNGVTEPEEIEEKTVRQMLAKFKIDKPYFLYLGTLKPSKNIPFLVKSFARYIEETGKEELLVIAGKKGWLFSNIFETVKEAGVENRVIFTDYISETEKWCLYKGTKATVIPSVYEGFGIPAIESMLMESPVIVSEIPPFLEVVGESGLYINPGDEADLCEKMKQISKEGIRGKLIAGGKKKALKYSWENSAKMLKEALVKINIG